MKLLSYSLEPDKDSINPVARMTIDINLGVLDTLNMLNDSCRKEMQELIGIEITKMLIDIAEGNIKDKQTNNV